jgi:hypothetical protein
MGTIKQTKKVKYTYRKSKQNAHVVKDKKGKNHCSACGAYIHK